jgi:hypothetical protein
MVVRCLLGTFVLAAPAAVHDWQTQLPDEKKDLEVRSDEFILT